MKKIIFWIYSYELRSLEILPGVEAWVFLLFETLLTIIAVFGFRSAVKKEGKLHSYILESHADS